MTVKEEANKIGGCKEIVKEHDFIKKVYNEHSTLPLIDSQTIIM